MLKVNLWGPQVRRTFFTMLAFAALGTIISKVALTFSHPAAIIRAEAPSVASETRRLLAYYFQNANEQKQRVLWCASHGPLPPAQVMSCESAMIARLAKPDFVSRFVARPFDSQHAIEQCSGSFFTRATTPGDVVCASGLVARSVASETSTIPVAH